MAEQLSLMSLVAAHDLHAEVERMQGWCDAVAAERDAAERRCCKLTDDLTASRAECRRLAQALDDAEADFHRGTIERNRAQARLRQALAAVDFLHDLIKTPTSGRSSADHTPPQSLPLWLDHGLR